MIRKGLQTLKNEQNITRKNDNNESVDPVNLEPI